MLQAVEEAQRLCLPRNNFYHQHTVANAIAVLRRVGKVKHALRLYEMSLVSLMRGGRARVFPALPSDSLADPSTARNR